MRTQLKPRVYIDLFRFWFQQVLPVMTPFPTSAEYDVCAHESEYMTVIHHVNGDMETSSAKILHYCLFNVKPCQLQRSYLFNLRLDPQIKQSSVAYEVVSIRYKATHLGETKRI